MAEPPSPASPQACVAQLLAALAAGSPSPDALQRGLAELARWRLACGDLQSAARLQRLAGASTEAGQVPPTAAIRAVLASLGQPSEGGRKSEPHAWEQLLRLLHRGHYRQASALQEQLLQGLAATAGQAALPEPEQRIALQVAWLQAGWGEQALALESAGAGTPGAAGAGWAAALAWWARPAAAVTESEAAGRPAGRSTDPS